MSKHNESGFSLIELILVVTIIGIVAAIAVPAFQKGMTAAENGSSFATLRVISSTQVNFFAQNGRFGRLTELQRVLNGALGTTVDPNILRRSEEHTSELQSQSNLVCRLLLEKKK